VNHILEMLAFVVVLNVIDFFVPWRWPGIDFGFEGKTLLFRPHGFEPKGPLS
jgi:hypothetical protein